MKTFDWDFSPPQSPPLGDHDVPVLSHHLGGRRVALLVCGGIAAMKAPLLARALRRRGAEVVAFCSGEALRYVGREALEWATCQPVVTELTWRAEHLSDATPFHAYLAAPATYNTVGKVAAGIADTVVTAALASALGKLRQRQTEVLVAPTMHGTLHNDILVRNCETLAALGVRFVTPRDDYGKHNLPDEQVLAAAVCRALAPPGLHGRRVLVVGGEDERSVQEAARVHEELLLRGADSALLLQGTAWRPAAAWLPVEVGAGPEEFRRRLEAHGRGGLDAVVFTGASQPLPAGVRVEAAGRSAEAVVDALADGLR